MCYPGTRAHEQVDIIEFSDSSDPPNKKNCINRTNKKALNQIDLLPLPNGFVHCSFICFVIPSFFFVCLKDYQKSFYGLWKTLLALYFIILLTVYSFGFWIWDVQTHRLFLVKSSPKYSWSTYLGLLKSWKFREVATSLFVDHEKWNKYNAWFLLET